MSDVTSGSEKKTRSALNVTKVLNKLRLEKGLSKVLTKEKNLAPRLTSEIKSQISTMTINELYPKALTEPEFVLTDAIKAAIEKEYKKKVDAFKAGKLKL